jgi:hypothetical protein
MKLYFCASHLDAVNIQYLQRGAECFGMTPVSSWPYAVTGPERFDQTPVSEVRAIAARNDRDLKSAHAAVVLPRDGVGAEMFGEARLALALGIPLVWVGSRRSLSAYREGVLRVDHVVEAMARLTELRNVALTASRLAVGLPNADDIVRFALWKWIDFFQCEPHGAERADAA